MWQAIRSLEVKMMKLAGLAATGMAVGVLVAVSLGVTVTILLIIFK
jgi:hypothetical protein